MNAKRLFKWCDCGPRKIWLASIVLASTSEQGGNGGIIYFPFVQHQPFTSVVKRSAPHQEHEWLHSFFNCGIDSVDNISHHSGSTSNASN